MLKTFGIFLGVKINAKHKYINDVIGSILKSGFTAVTLDNDMASLGAKVCPNKEEFFSKSDVLLSLGGDGTILTLAVEAAKYNLPIIGMNFGNLGFLSQAERGDNKVFEKILSGDFELEHRTMLCSAVLRKGQNEQKLLALNDIVISRGAGKKMLNIDIFINNQMAVNYPADGVIISTPTGSTAYSFAAGGPIVHPKVNVLLITPICAHTLRSRSLVLSDSDNILIKLNNDKDITAIITADGHDVRKLLPGDTINVYKSQYATKLITLTEKDFFTILTTKLSGGFR